MHLTRADIHLEILIAQISNPWFYALPINRLNSLEEAKE
jgi:hypothetical protein